MLFQFLAPHFEESFTLALLLIQCVFLSGGVLPLADVLLNQRLVHQLLVLNREFVPEGLYEALQLPCPLVRGLDAVQLHELF